MADFDAVVDGFHSPLARDLIRRAKEQVRSSKDLDVFLAIAKEARRIVKTRLGRLEARMAPLIAIRDKVVECDGCHRSFPAYKLWIQKKISCSRCRVSVLGCRNPDAKSIFGPNFEKLSNYMNEFFIPMEMNSQFAIDYPCTVLFEEFRKAKVEADEWPFNASIEAAIFRSVTLSGLAMDHYCTVYNDIKTRLDPCTSQIQAWNETFEVLSKERVNKQRRGKTAF